MNEELIQKSLELAGYNMLVTSEISMKDKDVYNAYHNLWRIEESFRIMKSQLDARPVYLQKQDTIVGHFLICYLAVLLTRLLQFKILKNGYSSEEYYQKYSIFSMEIPVIWFYFSVSFLSYCIHRRHHIKWNPCSKV